MIINRGKRFEANHTFGEVPVTGIYITANGTLCLKAQKNSSVIPGKGLSLDGAAPGQLFDVLDDTEPVMFLPHAELFTHEDC